MCSPPSPTSPLHRTESIRRIGRNMRICALRVSFFRLISRLARPSLAPMQATSKQLIDLWARFALPEKMRRHTHAHTHSHANGSAQTHHSSLKRE